MDEIIVLSLFDGMSCGRLALDRAGIKVKKYYASEIDKHAIKVTMANYPDTIQLGSVVDVDVSKLDKIELLCGGSPCQSFSFAGKRKGMSTKDSIEILTLEHYLELKSQNFEFEGQSYLFWEYMRVLKEIQKYNPDVKFLLENVIMGEKWQKILTKAIGINPIEINSALVSAQNRRRLYWTNIGAEPDGFFGDLKCAIAQPKDKKILLKDILETDIDEKYYLSDKMMGYFKKTLSNSENIGIDCNGNEYSEKSGALLSRYHKGAANFGTDTFIVASRGRNPQNPKEPTEQMLEPRRDGKTNCLTSVQKDNLICDILGNKSNCLTPDAYLATGERNRDENGKAVLTSICDRRLRRLTPTECCRLQTVKDNYFKDNYGNDIISDTQKYRCLGNGWTVDVISHIFSYLNK